MLQERYTEYRELFEPRSCRVAGLDVNYSVRTGPGSPVVFLPGGAGTAATWFEQAMRIDDDRTRVLVDLPISTSLEQLVAVVVGVLDAEHVERAAVVGTSLGGMLASAVARAHHDRVAALVLGNTGLYGPADASGLRAGLLMTRLLPRGILRRGATARVAGLLEGAPDAAFWAELAAQAYTGRDVTQRLRAQQVLLPGRVGRVDELSAPTPWTGPAMVIKAEDDELMSAECTQRLIDAHPGCDVRSLPTGGHLLPQTRPDDYASLIAVALGRVG